MHLRRIDDASKVSKMTTEVTADQRRGLDDRPEESTTTTEASEEEDEHTDYKNYNGCVGGG